MSGSALQQGLSKKHMLGYGVGGYGAAMFYNNFCFYALYFFTDYVGIAPVIASTIISLGAIWDAITDPLIGNLSDRRDPARGRRRPFILFGAIPLALFNWLVFTDVGLKGNAAVFYFALMTLGAYLFQTIVDIPYTALGAELTQDYDERAKLSAYRNFFWLVSIVVSSYFLGIASFAGDALGSGLKGYSIASLICSIPIVISLFITYYSTKGKELTVVHSGSDANKNFNWKKSIVEPLKNKPFAFVTALFALSIVAQAVNNSVSIYFYAHVLEMSEVQTANFLVFAAFAGFLGIWLAKKVSEIFSKKATWAIFMGLWAFSMGVIALFVLTPTSSLFIIIIFGLMYGMGMNVQYQLVWAMIPDCVEVDEFKTGERREGMFYGITSLVQKIGAALTIALAGVALSMIGYDGTAASQPDNVITGLRVLLGLGVTVPLLLSILFSALNPMSREKHAALREAISLKRAGKAYSTEKFADLL
jgi:sugar (glycoside-pentoside-hexuronide) transporter